MQPTPEFYPPSELVAGYSDKHTGDVFVLRSAPPEGLSELETPPNESIKDQISRYLWLSLSWSFWPGRPWIVEQSKYILPILDTLVERVDIKAWFDEGAESPSFEYTLNVVESFTEVSIDNTVSIRERTPFFYALVQDLLKQEGFEAALCVVFEITKGEQIDTAAGIDTRKGLTGNQSRIEPDTKKQAMHTNISMHSFKQIFGFISKRDPKFTSRMGEDWYRTFGQVVAPSVDKYGASLTDTQQRIIEGVMEAFTRSNYKGNLPAISKDALLTDFEKVKSVENLPSSFDNIDEIPCIKLGRRELVRLAGFNEDSQADVTRVTEAINYLATTTFCFYYNRLAVDSDNKPKKDKGGDWLKETVILFDTLLKVKIVLDESATQFQYYEISPSPIFLDQRSSYFLLIPKNWREEVKAKIGAKKASSYTYKFLLYLRYQFELKRRHNNNGGTRKKVKYEIVENWRVIAQELRLPESVWKDKKARALSILNDAYSAAKELGYITHYSRTADETKDTLILNPAKYPDPKQDTLPIGPQ